jgi:hypothetical protein
MEKLMKKLQMLAGLLLIAALLVGCGSTSQNEDLNADPGNLITGGNLSGDGDTTPDTMNEFSTRELPLMNQLMIGTFQMEDTAYAIDAEQAAELLPLWQVLKGLLESDTAATAEIDAVVNQIAETMTDEQMQSIAEMELTMETTLDLMQELGLDLMQRPEGAEGGEGGFQRPEGMPEGMGPGAGAGPGGMEGLSPEQLEAMQATREAGGDPMKIRMRNTILIDPLIELLQSKIS